MRLKSNLCARLSTIHLVAAVAVSFLIAGCASPCRCDTTLEGGEGIGRRGVGNAEMGEMFGPPLQGDERAELARRDPLLFLRQCLEHYISNVRDYRCIFLMREGSDGRLGEEQEIEIAFRDRPYSVHMRWRRHPVGAARISYVAGRWAEDGRERALVVPSGLLSVVAPLGVKLELDGAEMRAASSRVLTDFGFRRTLEKIIATCEEAQGLEEYDLRYVGNARLHGRECYVLRRQLPFAGSADGRKTGSFPERMLLIFIDTEWLVPIGCFQYADDNGEVLIGAFVTKDVRINAGVRDEEF